MLRLDNVPALRREIQLFDEREEWEDKQKRGRRREEKEKGKGRGGKGIRSPTFSGKPSFLTAKPTLLHDNWIL